MRFDLESSCHEPFFTRPGPCDHALRPGWSLDGSQIALVLHRRRPVPRGDLARRTPTATSTRSRSSRTRWCAGRPPGCRTPSSSTAGRTTSPRTAPLDVLAVRHRRTGSQVQLDLGIEGLQLTHADYSPEADKVLFLVEPVGRARDRRRLDDGRRRLEPDEGRRRATTPTRCGRPTATPIGVTVFTDAPDRGRGRRGRGARLHPARTTRRTRSLVADPPAGEVGIPVWGTR